MARHQVRALTIEGRRYETSGTLDVAMSPRAWNASVEGADIPMPKPASQALQVVVEAEPSLAVSGPASVKAEGGFGGLPLTFSLSGTDDFHVTE